MVLNKCFLNKYYGNTYEKGYVEMKKSLCILVAMLAVITSAFAYNYDRTIPLPGATLTDGKLQSEMLFPVYAYGLRIAAQDCKDYKITNTEVTKPKNSGVWEEVWTVTACTRTARIPIKFNTTENGTDFAIDPMGVKVKK